MIKYIFPQRLSVLAQVDLKMISLHKKLLLNLSAETIMYISNKLMVNTGNTFRNCLKGKLNRGMRLIKSLGSQTEA